ncbi:MAG: tRNA modification GTPase [Algibacter sp.]|uniref:tRNA modification GTPase n=1 Tax=Algibacter sp. TaxID=1872428 RepID=UPI0032978ECC
MKKLLFVFIALLQTINVVSQIKFEKGYYIDKSGNKVECYFKNHDFQSAPETIKYKLQPESEIKILNLKTVNEFSANSSYKFIRKNVEIGEAHELNKKEKDYAFKHQELFLKVLNEGKASLYSYNKNGNETFFFSTSILETKQLIFKSYTVDNLKTKQENRGYRKQLFDNLKCDAISFSDAINLKYEKKDLIRFFKRYNECENSKNIIYLKKQKTFNINLRPRINNASLTLTERGDKDNLDSYDFGSKTSFGIGVEIEALFSNNKWAVSIEPTYQKYNSEITTQIVGSLDETFTVDYSSLEMPLTLRHYSFINSNSKLFVNASLVMDFTSNSSILQRLDELVLDELDIVSNLNVAFGVGYTFKNKYSAELRFYSKRNVVNQLIDWTSSYNSTSIIFGCKLF